MTLIGLDISHHNKNMKDLHDLNLLNFVIMKATEGVKFKDPAMKTYLSILDPLMLRGFYHFCRADLGNAPEDEAMHFINTIGKNIDGKTILALDVEAGALKVPNIDGWCSIWMQVVEMATGIKPMIYTSQAECKRFQGVHDLGCGLWVAKWSKNAPTQKQISPWDFYAIWQYTSDNIFSGVRTDADIFNGSREQWLKYAEVDFER